MRFMMLVKHAEDSGPPPKELMDAMAKLSEEAVKAGTLVDSGGPAPTARRTRGPRFPGEGGAVDRPFPAGQEGRGGEGGFLAEMQRRGGRRGVGLFGILKK